MEMKALILFFCVAAAAQENSGVNEAIHNVTHFLHEAFPGIFVVEDLSVTPNYQAKISDITFYFYSRAVDGVEVSLSNLSSLSNTDFSNTKPTVFCIHGWRNDYKSDINVDIRTAYLHVEDANVFIVDWSKVTDQLYVVAQSNVHSVGQFLGHLILDLVNGSGLTLGNIVLVGHSLGAHIAGVAGKYIRGEADHVIGLDPAGPLFSIVNTENIITQESGKYVEIIHTNAGLLGMDQELGHADYWPNGGKMQPGCGIDIAGGCSHTRSFSYFAESLTRGRFIARKCANWIMYELGGCIASPTAYLGEVSVDRAAFGNYYLTTNDKYPYGQG